MDDIFLSFKWLNSNQVAVWVSDYLQVSMSGLGLAVRKIPYRERKGLSSYRYNREYRDDNGRWWVIDVTRPTDPPPAYPGSLEEHP